MQEVAFDAGRIGSQMEGGKKEFEDGEIEVVLSFSSPFTRCCAFSRVVRLIQFWPFSSPVQCGTEIQQKFGISPINELLSYANKPKTHSQKSRKKKDASQGNTNILQSF